MSYLRGAVLQSYCKCNFVLTHRLIARICTTVPRQKAENDSKPYPFMSKYKENKFTLQDTFEYKEEFKYTRYVVGGCVFTYFFYLLYKTYWLGDGAFDKSVFSKTIEVMDLTEKIAAAKKKGEDTREDEERLKSLQSQIYR